MELAYCKCVKQRLDNALIALKTLNLNLVIDCEVAAGEQKLEDTLERLNDIPDKVYKLVTAVNTPGFVNTNLLQVPGGIVNQLCGSALALFGIGVAVLILPKEIAVGILGLNLSVGSRKQNCALSIGINYTANLAVVKNKNILAVKVIRS